MREEFGGRNQSCLGEAKHREDQEGKVRMNVKDKKEN